MTDTLWQEIISDLCYDMGEWCDEHQRFHQPRERAVRCYLCGHNTWEVHGSCRIHKETV